MHIPNSIQKLEDARASLDNLKNAKDSIQYKEAFSSFLNSSRAVTNALQKECNKNESFQTWYESKRTEMKNDELMKFLHDARTEDFHEGVSRLEFVSNIDFIKMNPNLVMSKSPEHFSTGNTWEITLTGEGVSTLKNRGTPQEKRIMLDQTLTNSIQISIRNPPKIHRGDKIGSDNPMIICEHIIKYMENLVFEARNL